MSGQQSFISQKTTSTLWDCVLVGAGISGLAAREKLSEAGLKTITLEKSRGLGGRMSTRRLRDSHVGDPGSNSESLIDLGAQFVSARGKAFKELVVAASMEKIYLNTDSVYPRYIHPRGMSKLAHFLGERINETQAPILRQCKVTQIRVDTDPLFWRVRLESGEEMKARSVLLTAPIPQAYELLKASGIEPENILERELAEVRYFECIAAYFKLDSSTTIKAPGVLKEVSSDISGIFDQKLKGVHSEFPYVVFHASPALSRSLWDQSQQEVLSHLSNALLPYLSGPKENGTQWNESNSGVHRWRFCQSLSPLKMPFLRWHTRLPLYFCGDGFLESKVEGAFDSGQAAASALVNEIKRMPQ